MFILPVGVYEYFLESPILFDAAFNRRGKNLIMVALLSLFFQISPPPSTCHHSENSYFRKM